MSFEVVSHESHGGWFEKRFPEEEERNKIIDDWLVQKQRCTVGYWLHERLYQLADFLIKPNTSLLTVGDGYGFDALYFQGKGLEVTATDIAGSFLPLVKKRKLISDFSVENAEKMTFSNDNFDYVFCKEAYHHFPRPAMAVYEMLRVAKKGIIIIEPHDPLSRMPVMLALRNTLDRINPRLLQRYWKNRYSFEEVGNYVFKLSEREIEKLAMGINLPAVAFKGINNNYYALSIHQALFEQTVGYNSPVYQKIKRKMAFHNLLTYLGLMPSQVLSAIIFKILPDESTIQALEEQGYIFYKFPPNPYLKTS